MKQVKDLYAKNFKMLKKEIDKRYQKIESSLKLMNC